MRRLLPLSLLLLLALPLTACGSDDRRDAEPEGPVATQADDPAGDTEAEAPEAAGGEGVDAIAEAISEDRSTKPEIPQPQGEPPAQLETRDVVEGDGEEAAAGQTVAVQYVGASWSNGEEFDASWDRGSEPFEFPLGAGQVIQGWEQGVEGMKVGGRRLLVIPPDIGYGPAGSPPAIGPNETLVFVVDLMRVGDS
jgi:peptidylprolyl isomerase